MGQRARVLGSSVGLALLWGLAERVLSPPGPPGVSPMHMVAVFVLRWGAILLGASLLLGLQQAWFAWLRASFVTGGQAIVQWSRNRWPPSPHGEEPHAWGRELGRHVVLVAGLGVAVLDLLLTTLLLRDVFPEPPYRFPLLSAWHPDAGDWAFYGAVAGLKTGLALWFGLREGASTGTSVRQRWFILGCASAFDGILAVARGVALAEQGIAGAPIMVSNLVFAGFGLAVPWVVAHTGRVLATVVDPWIARAPAAILLTLVWALVLIVAAPVGVLIVAFALLIALWQAVDDLVGLVLGLGTRRRWQQDDTEVCHDHA